MNCILLEATSKNVNFNLGIKWSFQFNNKFLNYLHENLCGKGANIHFFKAFAFLCVKHNTMAVVWTFEVI
jgi:hypothetical protein